MDYHISYQAAESAIMIISPFKGDDFANRNVVTAWRR
jgi:hypothetical protein